MNVTVAVYQHLCVRLLDKCYHQTINCTTQEQKKALLKNRSKIGLVIELDFVMIYEFKIAEKYGCNAFF